MACGLGTIMVSGYRFISSDCGKLVYQTTKKRASGPKCPVTGKRIQGLLFLNKSKTHLALGFGTTKYFLAVAWCLKSVRQIVGTRVASYMITATFRLISTYRLFRLQALAVLTKFRSANYLPV
ncbi:hypothetical protein CTI12_AA579790 [Artemisia annua]|uniref:Uncharacterized protein n=1 Tax=Artemisia annua TaxID=35608 RepID=A0A2U1KNT3_ARTAN|nr:hypothetical protein CTI12_AA579790 [Artemisia annua]